VQTDIAKFPKIIVITGPTAVGKSAVALELSSQFGAEIVSADSRQIYRYLDIGTAKPTAAERAIVPHHLVDVVDPDEPYSAACFKADAEKVLQDLALRERVAFLVGGSPHYVQSVVDRLEIPKVPPQPEFRREMDEYARVHGHQKLHQMLRDVDPESAERIAATNVRRVIRALEVQKVTGEPFSKVGRRRGEPLPALRIAITTERKLLYRRIDERLDQQIRDGLLEETKRVLEMGYDASLQPLSGLVYREAVAIIRGKMGLDEGIERMKMATHAFARRQYAWFRRDPNLIWFEAGPHLVDQVREAISNYLEADITDRCIDR
jgi:tRNA dimethylallyltransferase